MGVNRTDGRCLDLLEHRGQMSAGELARASGLSTGAITAVIDRLEHAGYAQRVADPADRRRVLIEPTAKAFDRDAQRVEPAGQRLDDLERRGLLALDPEVVDRVDQRESGGARPACTRTSSSAWSKLPRRRRRAPCVSPGSACRGDLALERGQHR